jgi:uncharacterized protein (DUF2235 family)
MALYAFDGTGNEDREGELRDSNVLRFFEAYDDPRKDDNQRSDDPLGSVYLRGIGQMARTFFGDRIAEAFGIGGHRRVRQALRRLRNNLKDRDRTVDIVGFSRGAGIAISFANEVCEQYGDQLRIRFLGLWDTVGQFGLPGERLQAGHDLDCPTNVDHCYHAMAVDEDRFLFPLTHLQGDKRIDGVTEAWFRGVHSDVGGGNGNRALNAVSLHWMFLAARRVGVPLSEAAIAANLAQRNLAAPIKPHGFTFDAEREPLSHELLHVSVAAHPGGRVDPAFLRLSQIDDDGAITVPVN